MTPASPSVEWQQNVDIARELLNAVDRVLVTTHRHPDGDAIGSVLAVTHALERAGKTVIAHTPDAPPKDLGFLPGIERITHIEPRETDIDLVIALDHTEIARTGLGGMLRNRTIPLIVIDHHITSDRIADVLFLDAHAAATCEILAELLPALGYEIDSIAATCMLTGIVTDTGSFQHANTTPATLKLTAELLERGGNLRAIIHATYHGRPLAALHIMGRALERVETNAETGAAISVITEQDLRECGATVDDISGIVNMLNSLPESRFSLLLTEYERGKIKGSLRSEPEYHIDVSKIAAQFGGGGHKAASGFDVLGTLVHDTGGWHVLPPHALHEQANTV